jgi:hypothetical protein
MTEEKWMGIFMEENRKYMDTSFNNNISPTTWEEHKDALMELIKAVDEVTEVYNMENGVKQYEQK